MSKALMGRFALGEGDEARLTYYDEFDQFHNISCAFQNTTVTGQNGRTSGAPSLKSHSVWRRFVLQAV